MVLQELYYAFMTTLTNFDCRSKIMIRGVKEAKSVNVGNGFGQLCNVLKQTLTTIIFPVFYNRMIYNTIVYDAYDLSYRQIHIR